MHQYLLPFSFSGEKELTITGEDFHYLTRVLRLKSGDSFPARTARGELYSAQLISLEKKGCSIQLEQVRGGSSRSLSRVTLYQGIPKGKKFDQIVRQATEAGVSRIVPVRGEFCVSDIKSEGDFSKKRERWDKIIKEAFQQSASRILPEIADPLTLPEVLEDFKTGIGLFCHEKKLSSESLHGVLDSWSGEDVGILVGPEGGFSPKETDLITENSIWHAIYFGPNILRTETAALYSIAAVQTLLQEKQQWTIQNT